MTEILKKLFASAAIAGVGYLTQKLGPEVTAGALVVAAYISNHYFHKQLPPGLGSTPTKAFGVGDP